MGEVNALVLVDGLHSKQVLAALAKVVDLGAASLLLAYVAGPDPRAGLDLVRHRPGARPLPPAREHELREAEETAGESAVAEAAAAAREHGAEAETVRLAGRPGEAICELAVKRHADLVVVRAGGRDTPVGPGSLGPAARYIADHCQAPVLLLRT